MRRSLPATFMRGGTSKGLFLQPEDLPTDDAARDALLLRLLGSPDPYGQQMDGMGGGTSSTSKVALVSASGRDDCDLDYHVAAVSVGEPLVDWSGNCGNLAAAVAPFAFHKGILPMPADGPVQVRIWQVNTRRRIVAHLHVMDGEVCESGDLMLDGIAFPGSEIKLDFEAGAAGAPLFPTGEAISSIAIPGERPFDATLIDAGSPTILVRAPALGLTGVELPAEVNRDPALLALAERMRTHAAVAMGLAQTPEDVSRRLQQSPKLAFITEPVDHRVSDGRTIASSGVDLVARTFSMGKLHHAMTGTGTVALGAAAAVPGTLVSAITGVRDLITIGHASGTVVVGAQAECRSGEWSIQRTSFGRSARILMDGRVHAPTPAPA